MYCYIKGRRKRGSPPKKWIDNIKEDVKLMEFSIGEAVNMSGDREKWRSFVATSSSVLPPNFTPKTPDLPLVAFLMPWVLSTVRMTVSTKTWS